MGNISGCRLVENVLLDKAETCVVCVKLVMKFVNKLHVCFNRRIYRKLS